MRRSPPLSNSELEHLNALADGELGAPERAHWRERIAHDSYVRREFDKIVELKTKLGQMRPLNDDNTNPPIIGKNVAIGPRWAIAASVAFALLAGSLWFELTQDTNEPMDLIAWHKQYSGQQYVVKENNKTQFVSLGAKGDILVPDLEPSKLFLVDTKVIKDSDGRAVMHYRGLSGCRLTIWTGPTSVNLVMKQTATQRFWKAGERQYGIIATGMDEKRFESIAAYVQILTRISVPAAQRQRVAMVDAYKNSLSCA